MPVGQASHHLQGQWVSLETRPVSSGLESSTLSVTPALTRGCQRGHLGMSSEGLGESEEVREGGRGSRALSQSLGLSPKEGYTLSSSSGLDPPTRAEIDKPTSRGSWSCTSKAFHPRPRQYWGVLLLTRAWAPQIQFQDNPQATHIVPRLDFTEGALNVHAGP